MEYLNTILLFCAAILGSALNAVAGGGGFISYPSLLFCNIAPVNANGISTVALWPGNISSAVAYKKDINLSAKLITYFIIAISGGGFFGAYIFISTSPGLFNKIVPFFLLFSWLLFVFSSRLRGCLPKKGSKSNKSTTIYLQLFLLFLIGIYGGYFGAGLGIILLTTFSLFGLKNLLEMNGLKVILVSFNNGIAAITYIFSGIIIWKFTLIMLAGALIGGFYGAHLSKRFTQESVKIFVIVTGAFVTVFIFYKQFHF